MTNTQICFFWCLLFGIILLAPRYSVADDVSFLDKVQINGQVTAQHIFTDNRDLNTAVSDSINSQSIQPRLRMRANINQNTQAYIDINSILINSEQGGGAENDDGRIINSDDEFIELRQYWIRYRNLFDHSPLTLQIGRQRIKEDRTLWWNRDLDAVKLSYKTTLFDAFVGVGQNLTSYRTTDGDFLNDDEKRLRLFGEASWHYKMNHYFDIRALYENDYSNLETVGSNINPFDPDYEDNNLLWFGTRNSGTFDNITYRADIMGVVGEVDNLDTTFVSASARRVDGSTSNNILAWGFDGGIDIQLDTRFNPMLSFNYAYGSGDSNPNGTDGNFRQTGLQGNSSILNQSSGSLRNYGEVLRPELSNLHILSTGIGAPVSQYSDVVAMYHYYHLDEATTSFRSTSTSVALNGQNKSVGHGLDIAYNINLSDTLGWKQKGLSDTRLRLNLSGFKSGDAYGTQSGEYSARTFAEIFVRF